MYEKKDRIKYGSFKYMLKYGSLSNNPLCMIYINKSTICKGNGVFAKHDIPKNTMITWYYGYKKRDEFVSLKNKYGISINHNYTLLGVHKIEKLNNKGVAQIINDGICSNKKNNAYFTSKNNIIFVISRRHIRANQEILASYGIEYWIHQIQKFNYEFSYKFIYLIKIIKYLEKLVESVMDTKVFETEKWTNNKFQFILEKKRKCFYSSIYHDDNNFHLNIINSIFYKDIYYICNTCNSVSKLIDVYLE